MVSQSKTLQVVQKARQIFLREEPAMYLLARRPQGDVRVHLRVTEALAVWVRRDIQEQLGQHDVVAQHHGDGGTQVQVGCQVDARHAGSGRNTHRNK